MKRLLLSTLLGVFTLAATAQSAPDDSAVRIRGYQIELPAKPLHVFPGDFDVYKGAYDLSNGDTMVLLQRGHRLFADIGARPRTEMVAAAPNVFVGLDRQFKMTLSDNELGPVTGELVLVVPSRSAQANAAGGEMVRLVTIR